MGAYCGPSHAAANTATVSRKVPNVRPMGAFPSRTGMSNGDDGGRGTPSPAGTAEPAADAPGRGADAAAGSRGATVTAEEPEDNPANTHTHTHMHTTALTVERVSW